MYAHNFIFYTCTCLLAQYFLTQCTSQFTFTPILVNFKFVKSSHIFIYAFFYFFQIYAMCNMMKEYNRTECVPVCARTAYTWESVLYSKCNKIRSFYSKFFSNKNLSSFGVNQNHPKLEEKPLSIVLRVQITLYGGELIVQCYNAINKICFKIYSWLEFFLKFDENLIKYIIQASVMNKHYIHIGN